MKPKLSCFSVKIKTETLKLFWFFFSQDILIFPMTCKGGVFTVKVVTEEMLQTSYQMMKKIEKDIVLFSP